MSAPNAVLDSSIRELIDELVAEKAPPIYTLSSGGGPQDIAARAIRPRGKAGS